MPTKKKDDDHEDETDPLMDFAAELEERLDEADSFEESERYAALLASIRTALAMGDLAACVSETGRGKSKAVVFEVKSK